MAVLPRYLLDALEASGASTVALADGAGIDPEALDSHLRIEQVDRFLMAAWAAVDDPAFGLRAGASIRAERFGLVGLCAMTSETLGAAFERMVRFNRLVWGEDLELERRGGEATVQVHPAGPQRPYSAALVDMELASKIALARILTGTDIAPVRLRLRTSAPPHAARYRDMFACPVLFEQAENSIAFRLQDLELKVAGANPELAQVLEQHAENALAQASEGATTTRVRSIVRRSMDGTVPTLAGIADKMCVSTRTLQRRLTDEGVRFSDIVDAVRKELAEHFLLRDSTSNAEIAFQLGFADHSSFFRAFKRWTGSTPDTYRRAHQAAQAEGKAPGMEGLRFLVVDDAPGLRDATAQHLRSLGAQGIELAANGREALERLKRDGIDVVLTGWDMPEMDGLALLRAMRNDERLRKVPLIMMTAEAQHDKVQQAIASGVSDLLVKPYTSVRLKSKIEDSLQRAAESPTLAAAVGDPPHEARSAAPLTILVVDDAPDNLRLIAHLFEGQYRVRIANSGEKALAICTTDTPPDLVLLDVMMPGIDGFEVARRMREHPSSQLIPVIFVTALTSDQDWRRGLNLGAVDFVTKPIDPETLRIRVGNFMRYVAMHKQRQAEYDAMLAAARLREYVDEMLRHDLKGPLVGTLEIARLLSTDAALDSRQAKHAHLIQDTVLQVLNTVGMSSELFRIETGRFRLEQRAVPLHEILEQVMDLASVNFASKELVVHARIDAALLTTRERVLGDPTLCHSVFHNLVKNACDAAPHGTQVAVSLFDETPVRVVVQNRGAVPPAMRHAFFEREPAAERRGDAGMGAYSARLLVEAQGGSIDMAASDEDDTTTITVTLPRESAPEAKSSARPQRTQA